LLHGLSRERAPSRLGVEPRPQALPCATCALLPSSITVTKRRNARPASPAAGLPNQSTGADSLQDTHGFCAREACAKSTNPGVYSGLTRVPDQAYSTHVHVCTTAQRSCKNKNKNELKTEGRTNRIDSPVWEGKRGAHDRLLSLFVAEMASNCARHEKRESHSAAAWTPTPVLSHRGPDPSEPNSPRDRDNSSHQTACKLLVKEHEGRKREDQKYGGRSATERFQAAAVDQSTFQRERPRPANQQPRRKRLTLRSKRGSSSVSLSQPSPEERIPKVVVR